MNLKIPPPPFFITIIFKREDIYLFHNALESYRKLISPVISVVIPSLIKAAPTAVEVEPSIPLVPRFPSTRFT